MRRHLSTPLAVVLAIVVATALSGAFRPGMVLAQTAEAASADPAQRRAVPRSDAPRREPDARQREAQQRREPPRRQEIPPRYRIVPRAYYFPPIDVRLGFYYHPYFGFYYGPYYGPYYPYPGPVMGPVRYSGSALRTRVTPIETEVYVNGYYAGLVDDFDGVFQRLYLPPGEHDITLRLAGYETYDRAIYIAPGDTFELRHQMRPLAPGTAADQPPPPRSVPGDWTGAGEDGPVSPFGILVLSAEPADAQLYVDGEAWSGPTGLEEFVLHLPAGWHQIEVRKENHQPFAAKVDLREGETTRLSVTLEQ